MLEHLQLRAIAGRRGGEVNLAVGGREVRQHNLAMMGVITMMMITNGDNNAHDDDDAQHKNLLLLLLPRRCSNPSCLQAGRSAQDTQRLPARYTAYTLEPP